MDQSVMDSLWAAMRHIQDALASSDSAEALAHIDEAGEEILNAKAILAKEA